VPLAITQSHFRRDAQSHGARPCLADVESQTKERRMSHCRDGKPFDNGDDLSIKSRISRIGQSPIEGLELTAVP